MVFIKMSTIRSIKSMVTLVTGGASGLGKATVERFVQNGARVICADLPTSGGTEMVEALNNKEACFLPMDVTSEDDVMKVMAEIKNRYGELNCVVNCAGVGIAQRVYNPKKDLIHDLSEFQRVLTVNTVGTFNVISKAVKTMIMEGQQKDDEGQRGVIINTASVAAFDGQMGQAAYSASKSAIVGMTLPLARDMASMGIRINTICPGVIDTPLLGSLPPKVKIELSKRVLFPARLGLPEEYAHLVQCIVENPYMNAETIRMDGGLRMM